MRDHVSLTLTIATLCLTIIVLKLENNLGNIPLAIISSSVISNLLQFDTGQIILLSIVMSVIIFVIIITMLSTRKRAPLDLPMPPGEEYPRVSTEIDIGAIFGQLPPLSPPTTSPPTHRREEMAVANVLKRYASLIYWEIMALKEEYDLVVSLHEKGLRIETRVGETVVDFDTIYEIPSESKVRIMPICTACNVAPLQRDVMIAEFDKETRAEFKIRPHTIGSNELSIEFQLIGRDNEIRPLGKEKVKIKIQEKPYELTALGRTIKVSRKIPALASIVGGMFTFLSFVFSRFGINLEEALFTTAASISSGLAGVLMLGFGTALFFAAIKPIKRFIPITLG